MIAIRGSRLSGYHGLTLVCGNLRGDIPCDFAISEQRIEFSDNWSEISEYGADATTYEYTAGKTAWRRQGVRADQHGRKRRPGASAVLKARRRSRNAGRPCRDRDRN